MALSGHWGSQPFWTLCRQDNPQKLILKFKIKILKTKCQRNVKIQNLKFFDILILP